MSAIKLKSVDSKLVERAIYRLIEVMPYYAALIQSFKIELTQDVPTLGVKFDQNGKSINLGINPAFFASLSDDEQVAVLIHEASHVAQLHLIRIPSLGDFRKGNIAADLAINCYIPNIPKMGILPSQYRLRDFQSLEWYYARIAEKGEGDSKAPSKENPEGEGAPGVPGKSNGSSSAGKAPIVQKDIPDAVLDVHDWYDTDLTLDDKIGVIENVLRRAMEKLGNGAGEVPQFVEESLKALKDMKTKNWHRELKKFLGHNINAQDRERTWSRPNRRFGLIEAGSKSGQGKKLAVAFDTSGSMSVKELQRCLSEVCAMMKRGSVSGHLVLFDCQVNEVLPLRKNQEIQIHNRGGTSFVDLMITVDQLRCDALVIFTDGDDAGQCQQPKTPVLWVFTDGERNKYTWGDKVVLDR